MSAKKQRGSAWSIHLALNLYKFLGYNFLYYFMYPVTFFYFLMAKNAKEGLRVYYAHLGTPFTSKIYFEHLRIFAVCMVDRFIAKIEPQNYHFEYDKTLPKEILNSGTVLIYSHFGGWSASANNTIIKNKINIVMQEAMLKGIQEIEKKMQIKSNLNIIDLDQGTISVSVQIANALMNEEIVAMMADRPANAKAQLALEFLGEEAYFNKNPFQIAYKTSKPILVYFIVWQGRKHYKVEYILIEMDKTKNENDAIIEAMKRYVAQLEKMVKLYPQQWFNLYNFWEKK
ncbi:MAG: lysophospholipid acyltransferase family protein [Sulfurovum sp.]